MNIYKIIYFFLLVSEVVGITAMTVDHLRIDADDAAKAVVIQERALDQASEEYKVKSDILMHKLKEHEKLQKEVKDLQLMRTGFVGRSITDIIKNKLESNKALKLAQDQELQASNRLNNLVKRYQQLLKIAAQKEKEARDAEARSLIRRTEDMTGVTNLNELD